MNTYQLTTTNEMIEAIKAALIRNDLRLKDELAESRRFSDERTLKMVNELRTNDKAIDLMFKDLKAL